jgi:xylan 1,4-beta-xylosidase
MDFLSTHVYAGDNQARIFGQAKKYTQNEMIPAAMAQVRSQIDATKYKGAQLWLSEWSSDSPAMIAHVVTHCLPYCHAMSQWQVSGVFEEILTPNYIFKEGDNGWGLMSQRGVVRPAFNTYKLMNRLGGERLESTGPTLASRKANGGSAILLWNLADVPQASGIPGASSERKVTGLAKRYRVTLRGAKPGRAVKVSYVDQHRGSPYPTWRALGSPQYPTKDQLAKIRAAAELGPPEVRKLGPAGDLVLDLPPEGVALIELA